MLILMCTNLKSGDGTCDRDRISALLIRYCYIKILVSISHTILSNISHTATKYIYINMCTESSLRDVGKHQHW